MHGEAGQRDIDKALVLAGLSAWSWCESDVAELALLIQSRIGHIKQPASHYPSTEPHYPRTIYPCSWVNWPPSTLFISARSGCEGMHICDRVNTWENFYCEALSHMSRNDSQSDLRFDFIASEYRSLKKWKLVNHNSPQRVTLARTWGTALLAARYLFAIDV